MVPLQTGDPTRPPMLSLAGLKARGWTARLITTFLGEPDTTAANPHYRTGPPMRLYLLTRVETCEATPAWQEAAQVAAQRRTRATQAAAVRRAQLLAWVDAQHITVPLLAPATLTARACAHYNDGQFVPAWRLGDDREPATPASSPGFLARITVNYLRHQCTRYEALLEKTFGKVGVEDARKAIRGKVYAAIATRYPALAAECQRQQAARNLSDAGEETA